MCNCSSFKRKLCDTLTHTHTQTHTHGANYNLPPACRAGDKKKEKRQSGANETSKIFYTSINNKSVTYILYIKPDSPKISKILYRSINNKIETYILLCIGTSCLIRLKHGSLA